MSTCKINAGGLVFELDATDEKALFEKIAHIQEIFDQTCGKCGSNTLKYVTRVVDDNKYYELRCKKCGAKLSYGCHKKGGTLFPKRKDDQNQYLADSGWLKWNKESERAE